MVNYGKDEGKRPLSFLPNNLQHVKHGLINIAVATCLVTCLSILRNHSTEDGRPHLQRELVTVGTTTSPVTTTTSPPPTSPTPPTTNQSATTNADPQYSIDAQSIKERRDRIYKALKARDDYLGEQYSYPITRMGDISTTLISDQIDRYAAWAAQPWVRTICEIGFAIGTSTITYLESNPEARVISFDIMQMNGASEKALSFVQERYGSHHIQTVVGPSDSTLPTKQGVFGGLCDVISVDGMHDMTALKDLQNFQPFANPVHHVLLADDCVPDEVFDKKKAVNPHVGYFPDVWHSWQQLVKEGIIHHHSFKIHGGQEDPTLESYSGNVKGWCEGHYATNSETDTATKS